MLILGCALALAASPAPQSAELMEVLIRQGDPIPGLSGSDTVFYLQAPVAGRGGGWVARVHASDDRGLLIGQRPSQVAGPVELIREPRTIGGVVQPHLTSPSMANGQVAYLVADNVSFNAGHSAWVEDQRIAAAGDPVVGAPGWTWTSFGQIELTTSGTAWVYGTAATGSAGGARKLVWEWPAGVVRLAEGQAIAGLSTPVHRLDSRLQVSPNGSHWSIIAEEVGVREAVVVDGEVLDAGGGHLVINGEPIPADIYGNGAYAWRRLFKPAHVNDAGDVAFEGESIEATTGDLRTLHVRNGRLFDEAVGGTGILGITERGALLLRSPSHPDHVRLEEQLVLNWDPEVDEDGDGVGDPGYQVWLPTTSRIMEPNSQSLTILLCQMTLNGVAIRPALFRARDFRVDRPTCAGVPNSTGYRGQLVASGSAIVPDNEVSFQIFGLPTGSTGYALVSRSPGFVVQAGGGQGNLCLSGTIGRMVQQVFTIGSDGRAVVSFDLSAIPQPSGSIAAMAGETWLAQAWYRDIVGGASTSNLTGAAAVTLR